MTHLPEFLAVVVIHLLAVMSPGPDFLMITRNSLVYSRKTGVYSAIGLGLGILVHVTYSLIGIGLLISKSILLFSSIKLLGAIYLIFIGYKSLKAKPNLYISEVRGTKDDISKFAAIKLGFFTNVLNPKATLFFLALFTQVIHPTTPIWIKIFYGIEMSVVTFLWFSLVTYMFSHNKLKAKINSAQNYIEKAAGIILIALGIKIALSKSQ